MPVMAVHNENQHEEAGDHRSRPRWSAGKKMEAVLRLLRGESRMISRNGHAGVVSIRGRSDARGLLRR
jgi:hypothetical protein